MAMLMVLYKKPADEGAFDAHYFNKHIPLAKAIPGLRRYEVSQGPVATPEGQATAADLANFAQAGVQLLMCDTRSV